MLTLKPSRVFARTLCVLALAASTAPAGAALITLDPTETAVGVGNPFTVNLTASLQSSEDLASLFIDVVYDPTVLSFESVELTDALGTLGIDALDISLPPEIAGGVGLVNLTVESLLADFSTQPDLLSLATLTFTALQPGITPLTFGDFSTLNDPTLAPLTLESVGSTISATVDDTTGAPVPEPAIGWLLASALLVLLRRRRRLAAGLRQAS